MLCRVIAATVLLLSSNFVHGQFEPSADLIVTNGRVITLDSVSTVAEAVAIRAGKIIYVGSSAEAQKLAGERTQIINADGRCVIPGLIESHVHATGAARGEASQPFVQLGSIAEIQQWVRDQAAQTPADQWIRLPRVDVTRIRERRLPNRADLDQASPNHPAVFVWQYANRQVQVLNTTAIKAAGITKETKAPPRGVIRLDENGNPNGILEDCGPLTSKFIADPKVSDEAYLDSLVKLLRRYNACGITSIGERGSNEEGVRTYQKLKEQNRLTVRATVTIRVGTDKTLEGAEAAIRKLKIKPGEGDDWVKAGPLKLSVDGGVLYGTAFMREPYGEKSFGIYGINDPLYRGLLQHSPEEVKNFVRAGHKLGWQCSTHVTGDAGVDAVLDAVEAANSDRPIQDRRFTLIHAYFANEETAKRASRLGVCVDTQPAWYYKDGDTLAEALGGHRLQEFIGLNVWRNGGVKVALNSDHMQGFGSQSSLNPYDPFLTMYVAVSRKTEGGQVFGPHQRITREAALRMLTIDAAYLSFDENNRGSLEIGKFGDLAILSDNPLTCDEERIKDIHSEITIVGGKLVYQRHSDEPQTKLPQSPLFQVVDLNIGEESILEMANGKSVKVKPISLHERRDSIRDAVRSSKVVVEIDGEAVTLASGNYELPKRIGSGSRQVQIDCPITSGYNTNGTPESWGLDKQVRLRIWPGDSPWMPEGSFLYPIKQRWFASATQMANEPSYVDGGEPASRKKIYYHSGLDIGGSEGHAEVIAATEGLIVSVGTVVLDEYKKDSPVEPRYDVVYLRDARGWFYRYSHLKTIDPAVVPGRIVNQGGRIGMLGKEGGSGGWSHLHFEIKAKQPSGKWGTQEGYAFLWEAYQRQYQPSLIAVARPHHLIKAGETIELDGSRSWSKDGSKLSYRWQLSDGQAAEGPRLNHRYTQPGTYSEILEVRDEVGRVAYDFAMIQVHDPEHPAITPPTIHAVYHPTQGIQAGDEIVFKVRSFGAQEPEETWNFGDGTPEVKVRSDGNAKTHNPNGYAVTSHVYSKPGNYIVRVERTTPGYPAIAHLQVVVGQND